MVICEPKMVLLWHRYEEHFETPLFLRVFLWILLYFWSNKYSLASLFFFKQYHNYSKLLTGSVQYNKLCEEQTEM